MKLNNLCVIVIFCLFFSVSCAMVLPGFPNSKSWYALADDVAGSIWISSVTVDKASGGFSVEREINDLLPLIFLHNNYFMAISPDSADLFAEVKIREREYSRGWNMERSISVEVYFKSGIADNALILSAGRVMIHGNKSLSSSGVLNKMLEQAVKKTVKALVVL